MGADTKKKESSIEYSWNGIGKLKILFRGHRNATLRFDPDIVAKGRIKDAKGLGEEATLQHQEERKTVPTKGQAISETLEKPKDTDIMKSR